MADAEAVADAIRVYLRRLYLPSAEDEAEFAGMTRGERQEEVDRRIRHGEHLVCSYRITPKPDHLSSEERAAEVARRTEAYLVQLRDYTCEDERAVEAEADAIRDYMRRLYLPTAEDEKEFAGMTRGERQEEVDRRIRHCEALVYNYRTSFKPDKSLSEKERAAAARRRKAHLALLRDYSHALENSTLEDDDFSDMGEDERSAEAERRRKKAMDEARCLEMARSPAAPRRAALARILDFDPKQGGEYYNRTSFRCCDVDLDEESPLGPMRLTDKVYKNKAEYEQDLCRGLNIFSVKITSSDVAFPLHVYGTVVARDSIDYKCIYLFRRDKDHSQLIDSETQSLILTGPK